MLSGKSESTVTRRQRENVELTANGQRVRFNQEGLQVRRLGQAEAFAERINRERIEAVPVGRARWAPDWHAVENFRADESVAELTND